MHLAAPFPRAVIRMMSHGAIMSIGIHAVDMRRVQPVAMMTERHALPGRHGGHALQRQDQRDHEDKSMHKPTHGAAL